MMCVQEERHPAPAPAPGPSTSAQEGSGSSAGVASVPQHRRQVGNIRYRPAILYLQHYHILFQTRAVRGNVTI